MQIKFGENDKELIARIKSFQEAKGIRYFVEAVGVLCNNALDMKETLEKF